jgi:sugar-specific transcriptional regulator TrmB
MEPITQDPLDWEKKLSQNFEKLGILEGEDLKVYLEILKSQKDLTGKEIFSKFEDLKRTHVYSILKRLQNDGWIELTNPGIRPAKYRAINPLHNVKTVIENHKKKLIQFEGLRDYINKEVLPALSDKQRYGGRISNTYIIPTLSDMYHQIIEHIRKSLRNLNEETTRLMVYISYELFIELKDFIIPTINEMFERFQKKGIILRDEDRRDKFALIITGKKNGNEIQYNLPERLRIVFDPNEIHTDMIVIDDVVFINNINSGFGLSFRIEDKRVASTYGILLSHIYLEKQIELHGKADLSLLGDHLVKDQTITQTIQSLFKDGWKILPEHTNSTEIFDELGLAAPGSETAFFRLCGIRYFPFNKNSSKSLQINKLFEDTCKRGQKYINRLKKQVVIEGKKDRMELLGQDCHVYIVEYRLREEWAPIIGNVPNLTSLDEKGKGNAIATFNFNDKAAMSVWAINPENVMEILKILFKNL